MQGIKRQQDPAGNLQLAREPGWIMRALNLISLSWSQKMALAVYGLLLVLVVVCCTVLSTPWIALEIGAAIALVVALVINPVYALLLIFICAGLPSLKVPLTGQQVHLVHFALMLCPVCILLRRPTLRLRLPHLLALLFVLLSLVSFVHVPEISPPDAYGASKRLLVILSTALAFFAGAWLVQFVKNYTSFLLAALCCNLPLYLIALAQALHLHVPSLLENSRAQDPTLSLGRLWGPTSWPSTFGMYLSILYAMALACWLLAPKRSQRVLGLLFTLASALEIIGSGTRSVLIATVVITFVVLLITRRFKLLAILSGLTIIGAALLFPKLIELFTERADSFTNRLLLWNLSFKLIAQHPWIGVGLSQFRNYYDELVVSQVARLGMDASPHQQYLEWAVESGVFAFLVASAFLVSIVALCWRFYRVAARDQQILLLATGAAVLATVIIGFVDVPLDQSGEGPAILFMLAGLATGCMEHLRQAQPELLSWPIPSLEPLANWRARSKPRPSAARESTPGSSTGPLTSARGTQPLMEQLVIPGDDLQEKVADEAQPDADAASPHRLNARKTSHTILFQLLGWGIALPIIFPVTALLTHYLGPAQYGDYMFTFTYLTIFALLSGTGMDPLIIRQLSRSPRSQWRELLSTAAGTRFLSTTVSSVLLWLVTWLLPLSTELRSLLFIGGCSLFFSFSVNCLRAVYSHGFRAEQHTNMLIVLETVNRLVTAGLIGLVVLWRIPLIWAYALIVFSDLPSFLILVWMARRRYGMRLHFNLARARSLFKEGMAMTSYDLLTLVAGQADLLLLMALTGPGDVGIYALAMRLTDPLQSAIFAYANGLYPLLCVTFKQGRAQFDRVCQEATRILALVMVPFALLVTIYAPAIVALFGGRSFAAASTVVQLLIWTMVCTFFNILATRIAMAANHERRVPLVTLCSLCLNGALNLSLIPRWQYLGAGIAALTSEFLALCLFGILLRSHVRLGKAIWHLVRVLIANLPALLFLLWSTTLNIFLAIPVALLLTIFFSAALRVITWGDVRSIRHFLSTRRQSKAETLLSRQISASR